MTPPMCWGKESANMSVESDLTTEGVETTAMIRDANLFVSTGKDANGLILSGIPDPAYASTTGMGVR